MKTTLVVDAASPEFKAAMQLYEGTDVSGRPYIPSAYRDSRSYIELKFSELKQSNIDHTSRIQLAVAFTNSDEPPAGLCISYLFMQQKFAYVTALISRNDARTSTGRLVPQDEITPELLRASVEFAETTLAQEGRSLTACVFECERPCDADGRESKHRAARIRRLASWARHMGFRPIALSCSYLQPPLSEIPGEDVAQPLVFLAAISDRVPEAEEARIIPTLIPAVYANFGAQMSWQGTEEIDAYVAVATALHDPCALHSTDNDENARCANKCVAPDRATLLAELDRELMQRIQRVTSTD